MSGRRAKRLRKEARERGDKPAPKRLFAPILIPMPSGKVAPDEEGYEDSLVPTYVPRRVRRAIMRRFLADYRKGRTNDR